jgi:GNAT superfamily N-acetyltransferase
MRVLTGMSILTYRELKQKNTLLPLMEQAFGWPFDPVEFQKTIKADPRLRDGSVGFCFLKQGKLFGYVGVMDLTLRTVTGKLERVGGLYGVATLPGYTRQGVCTTLINRAHEYFLEKGYHFSFLTTSPTIVAHALYSKLGYSDVASLLSAYKIKEKTEQRETSKHEAVPRWDYDRMLKLFHEYVRGRTGFAVRDEAYVKMIIKQYEISPKECIMTQEGYVIFKKEKRLARIRELVARSQREMSQLIGLVEDKARSIVIGRLGVWNPIANQAYRSRGFTVLETGYGVLMVKELVSDASFSDSYGDRFQMSPLDGF